MVHSDPMLIELILRNLVTNAIRYTHRGGVLVACRKRGNQVLVEVWDTGIDIEASQYREIFREFHQLGNPERDRNKGLGLGLAIVDGLVRVLGHQLSLVSRLGRGSVFKLLLPVSQTPILVMPAVIGPVVYLPLPMKVLVCRRRLNIEPPGVRRQHAAETDVIAIDHYSWINRPDLVAPLVAKVIRKSV